MKQDIALADLLVTMLSAVLCVAAVLLADAVPNAPARSAAQEARYADPGRAKADESAASAKHDDTAAARQDDDER